MNKSKIKKLKNPRISKNPKNLNLIRFKNPAKFDNYIGIGKSSYHFSNIFNKINVLMKPSIFLTLAYPLEDQTQSEFIVNHIKNELPIAVPFLTIGRLRNKDLKITGHEGRNRMLAIFNIFGDEPTRTLLIFENFYVDNFPEIIKELNKGMISEDGNFVKGPLAEIIKN